MNAITCIKERRSIRNFTTQKISHEQFEEIVEAARYAPSWKNSQIVRYLVIENQELINELADNCVNDFEFNRDTMRKAAALVIVTYVEKRSGFERDGSYSTDKGDRWEMFDAGIATQTFCLAAYAYGIASVILGIFNEEKVIQTLKIPAGQRVGAIIAVGYASEHPNAPKRKEVSDLLCFL